MRSLSNIIEKLSELNLKYIKCQYGEWYALLTLALPISKGFYNWRNLEQDNVMFIKEIINRPIEDVDELAGEVYWCDSADE